MCDVKVDSKAMNVNKRVVIEGVYPEIDGGQFPIKRALNQKVIVEANIFADGHDHVVAVLLYKKQKDSRWESVYMQALGNDRWRGEFLIEEFTAYEYCLEGWIDHFLTWRKDVLKKAQAQQDIRSDIQIGLSLLQKARKLADQKESKRLKALIESVSVAAQPQQALLSITSEEVAEIVRRFPDTSLSTRYSKQLTVFVEREKSVFSSWYEVFVRSCASLEGQHGTFLDCIKLLPQIARMGFDVLYLTPIHPIGEINRKGKNNSIVASGDDPGSPWAIGSKKGGHKALHPKLGSMTDFTRLIKEAKKHSIEIAMDIAFQCSPDHPFIAEHPSWFMWRPDNSIQFAENPPKKYEDIVPLNFETPDYKELWDELKDIFLFWAGKGVRIFRVDNPHTKPFSFWQWIIDLVKREYPDVLFLAEAFTRPKVMYRLAKAGFSQSYTYYTWRNTKQELTQYLTELTQTQVKEFFRPNFWPNTPDILPEFLQYGGRPAFIIRLILASTLSSNYGIYGQAFELCTNAALPEKEEYLDSEKYELKTRLASSKEDLTDLITRVNAIRHKNPALQDTNNISFLEIDNDKLIAYVKSTEDGANSIVVIVNLDPFHTQSGWLRLPLERFGVGAKESYLMHDLLSNDKYIWTGERNYIELNPSIMPVHILRIHRRMRREQDFDYFM